MWNAIKGLGGIMFDGKSLVDALERIYTVIVIFMIVKLLSNELI